MVDEIAEKRGDDEVSEGVKIDENRPSSQSPVANTLSTLLSTLIKDLDSQAETTIDSQHQLASSLDRLNGELDQLLEDAPLPFIMQHGARISGVRERVRSLNSVLKSVQRRLDNIDRLISPSVLQDKVVKDSSRQQ